jgi:hypothetical protein
VAAQTVIQYRKTDGANSEGDMPGSSLKAPVRNFSDWTGYYPINAPQYELGKTDCSTLRNLNRWQPLYIPRPKYQRLKQQFLAAHAGYIKPFAVEQFEFVGDYSGPGLLGTTSDAVARRQAAEVLHYSATLSDERKVIAEFWADGPNSALPPGHWNLMALEVIKNEALSLADAVKLTFLQANAVFDAGIISWGFKRIWDNSRPITLIQCLYQNNAVKSWQGPYKGVGVIRGGNWQPYQNPYFVTPAFSEYISGHSTFSGAAAKVFQNFFGDDTFRGDSFVIRAGKSLFEPRIDAGQPGYVAGVTDVPNQGPETVGYSPAKDVTLSWKTWTEAAQQAGLSRLYGGIHFKNGNEHGLDVGARVGEKVWARASDLWNGKKSAQTVV